MLLEVKGTNSVAFGGEKRVVMAVSSALGCVEIGCSVGGGQGNERGL